MTAPSCCSVPENVEVPTPVQTAKTDAIPYSVELHNPLKSPLRGRFESLCQACSSSSKALASFKSSVPKPSVNQS
jgi:hypothetical protein